jgi:hypothetical protein
MLHPGTVTVNFLKIASSVIIWIVIVLDQLDETTTMRIYYNLII